VIGWDEGTVKFVLTVVVGIDAVEAGTVVVVVELSEVVEVRVRLAMLELATDVGDNIPSLHLVVDTVVAASQLVSFSFIFAARVRLIQGAYKSREFLHLSWIY
jgi:hypothetical protein